MDTQEWNRDFQHLKNIIRKPDYFEEAKMLSMRLHAFLYVSEMSESGQNTLEDELWKGLTENILRGSINKKGRTVLYGLWHSTRIEDITMNLLVTGKDQIFEKNDWMSRINSSIRHTGNSLNGDEIQDFSKNINIEELKKYRIAVGRNSRKIIESLEIGDFKRKIIKDNLQRILDECAVDNVPAASWLIDFWAKKDIAGIILMPCLRHQLIHINESFKAKNHKN
jgi:hypothetical protein